MAEEDPPQITGFDQIQTREVIDALEGMKIPLENIIKAIDDRHVLKQPGKLMEYPEQEEEITIPRPSTKIKYQKATDKLPQEHFVLKPREMDDRPIAPDHVDDVKELSWVLEKDLDGSDGSNVKVYKTPTGTAVVKLTHPDGTSRTSYIHPKQDNPQ